MCSGEAVAVEDMRLLPQALRSNALLTHTARLIEQCIANNKVWIKNRLDLRDISQ